MINPTSLRLGTIGTSSISQLFVQAALATDKYELTTVYSRKEATARTFGEPFHAARYVTTLEELGQSDVDVVYIASPNSLHFEQTMQMLEAGKHVIVEKPMFSTPGEWETAAALAQEKGVCLFEAARHIHDPNFQKATETIRSLENVQGASLTYMKYSSRYDAVLNGEEPPIFSLNYSGGALMDLGVYLVYAAVSWFGEPEEVTYIAQKIRTGVDGQGIGMLRYPGFDVVIHCGKNALSLHSTEIYGLDETLVLDHAEAPTVIERVDSRTQASTKITLPPTEENPLSAEAAAFADLLLTNEKPATHPKYQEWLQLSQTVNRVLTDMRHDAGIYFPADQQS